MKTISFSVVKILSHLLDKTKTQTIRPAWNVSKGNPRKPTHGPCCTCQDCGNFYDDCVCKPPYLKVNEGIRLLWKQRCKYKIFWRNDGEHFKAGSGCNLNLNTVKSWNVDKNRPYTDTEAGIFHKEFVIASCEGIT